MNAEAWHKGAGFPGGRNRRGFALVVVILVLLLVSFLVSNLVMQVRAELKIATNVRERAAGRFLAEGGVKMAVFRKQNQVVDSENTEYERFLEGYPYTLTLAGRGRMKYLMASESGKIDLNKFQRPIMELFLAYHGLEEEEIDTVIDSLLDWRDPDNLHRLNGAEEETYSELDDPYIPRNGRIQDPGEFFLVHGTERLRGRFDPHAVFTVYGDPKINFNSLTPEMLEFLVEGDEEKKAAYYLFQEESVRRRAPLSAVDAQEILGAERYVILLNYLSWTSRNQYFYIEATGEAGYDAESELSPETDFELETQRHWPGVKIQTLYRWQNNRPRYLVWKESYT